jgi:DNA-binding Lrp family transcriptional regulator
MLKMLGYTSLLLERPHAIEVLLRLRENLQLPLMDLQFLIATNRLAVRRRVDELVRAGIIRAEVVMYPKRRLMLALTPLGHVVADRLAEIELVVKNGLPDQIDGSIHPRSRVSTGGLNSPSHRY